MAAPILDLQPRTGGDIIDAAVTLYRRHFARVLTLAAIPLPMLFLTIFWMDALGKETDRPGALVLYNKWGLLLLGQSWFTFVRDGALSRWTSEIMLGRQSEVGGCYLPLLRRGLSLLFLLAVYLLGLGGPFVPGVVLLGIFMRTVRHVAWTILVSVLLLGPAALGAFLVLVRLTLALVIIAAEDAKCSRALKRSWRLVRGNMRRGAAITLFSLVLSVAPAALGYAVDYLMETVSAQPEWEIWKNLGLLVASALLTPMSAIASTLFYFDCRVRHEALDLEVLARVLGAPEAIPSIVTASQPTASAEASATDLPSPSELLHDPVTDSSSSCIRCGLPVPPGQSVCHACGAAKPFDRA